MKEDWTVVIADYGLARNAALGSFETKESESLPWPWMPPEALKDREYTEK